MTPYLLTERLGGWPFRQNMRQQGIKQRLTTSPQDTIVQRQHLRPNRVASLVSRKRSW